MQIALCIFIHTMAGLLAILVLTLLRYMNFRKIPKRDRQYLNIRYIPRSAHVLLAFIFGPLSLPILLICLFFACIPEPHFTHCRLNNEEASQIISDYLELASWIDEHEDT